MANQATMESSTKQEILPAGLQTGDFPMSVDRSELYKVALRRFTHSANNDGGCLDEMVTSKIASVSV